MFNWYLGAFGPADIDLSGFLDKTRRFILLLDSRET